MSQIVDSLLHLNSDPYWIYRGLGSSSETFHIHAKCTLNPRSSMSVGVSKESPHDF
jgi:hypothetical protein